MLFSLLQLAFACRSNKTPIEDRASDAQEGYAMYTEKADLLVSDSGITQYHLVAEAWYIYDKGEDARWYFPRGFYGEQVDTLMQTKAMLKADTAYYFTLRDQWLFIGNVVVENLSGDRFLAHTLQWDSEERIVSSEDSVTVISQDRTLSGTSFRANQDFSKYVFLNNSGSVSVSEDDQSDRATAHDDIAPPKPEETLPEATPARRTPRDHAHTSSPVTALDSSRITTTVPR